MGQLPWNTAFKASTKSDDSEFETPAEPVNSPHEQLHLYGRQVDLIETVGKPWRAHYIDGYAGDIPGIAAYLLDIANLCQRSNIKFTQTKHVIYATDFDGNHAHTRITVAYKEEYVTGFIRRATGETDEAYSRVIQEVVNTAKEALSRLETQSHASQNPAPNSALNMPYKNMIGWQDDHYYLRRDMWD
jgi:hypothetical protein